jgi:hypothetical protein
MVQPIDAWSRRVVAGDVDIYVAWSELEQLRRQIVLEAFLMEVGSTAAEVVARMVVIARAPQVIPVVDDVDSQSLHTEPEGLEFARDRELNGGIVRYFAEHFRLAHRVAKRAPHETIRSHVERVAPGTPGLTKGLVDLEENRIPSHRGRCLVVDRHPRRRAARPPSRASVLHR